MSQFTKAWIIEHGVPIAESYHGNLTLRALHYRLVAAGMTNDLNHYKKVVSAMIDARWDGLLDFEAFLDHERESLGKTDYEETSVDESVDKAKDSIRFWANYYRKNRWENQPIYPEVFIEKKALIGVFEGPCKRMNVALNPCKGYPSLTFLNDAAKRFDEAMRNDKECVILYFGDYDPSGEDIPRSIGENISRLGTQGVEVRRIALMKQQVIKWKLPPAPTKKSDTRSGSWDGLGQVELDAVEPKALVKLCEDAISSVFDKSLYGELLETQAEEVDEFKSILKRDFKSLLD